MSKGLIHVYTGEGQGKSSAATGLAIRAAGQGMKVCFVQFLKGGNRGAGEQNIIEERIPEIELIVSKISHPIFLKKKPLDSQYEAECKRMMEVCREKAAEGDIDLLVLDEINNVLSSGWLDIFEVIDLLENRPENMEVVMTGRDAPPQLQSMAHYVTEMLKIKHPYDDGIIARRGIDY
jgi:cob(I)alamin adenosyltransferase